MKLRLYCKRGLGEFQLGGNEVLLCSFILLRRGGAWHRRKSLREELKHGLKQGFEVSMIILTLFPILSSMQRVRPPLGPQNSCLHPCFSILPLNIQSLQYFELLTKLNHALLTTHPLTALHTCFSPFLYVFCFL